MYGASLGRQETYRPAATLRQMTGRTKVKGPVASLAAILALFVALVAAAPAAAHGDIASSSPEAGARVKRAPRQVRLVLAEPPAAGSDLRVIDACGERVSGQPTRDGDNIAVSIDGGRPGRWQVRLRSISSVDGHTISEGFAFRVAGKRDCSAESTENEPSDDETDQIDTSSRPPIENDEQGSSFPVVPFALGTIVVVGVAIALRGPRNSNKS